MRTRHGLAIALAAMSSSVACVSFDMSKARIEWSSMDARLVRILQLEDARATNDGELLRMAESEDVSVRALATRALGRMPYPEEGAEVTRALLRALTDSDAGVRSFAAFGLGLRGDPSAADKLLFVALDYHESDDYPFVRAQAIEAASKLDRPELRERVLDGLLDVDANVRLEAAEGASRWPTSEANAGAINQRLVDSLAKEQDRNVIVYTLFALERRKAKEALDAFVRFASVDDDDQRLFAVRGLKALAPDPRVLEPLIKAAFELGGAAGASRENRWFATDARRAWRAQCEATLGLGAFVETKAVEALGELRHSSNAHTRRCALEALTAIATHEPPDTEWGATVVLAIGDANPNDELSSSVRGACLEAHAQLAATLKRVDDDPDGDWLRDSLDWRAFDRDLLEHFGDDANVRVALTRAWGASHDDVAVEALAELARDPDLRVAGAAIEAFGKHKTPQSRAALHGYLAHADNGLRLAAVTALAEMPDASDVEPLKRCYESSTGDGANEIRFNALRGVAKLGPDAARELLSLGALDDNPFVRRVAREEAKKLDITSPQLEQSLAYRSDAEKARLTQPLGLESMPAFPRVEILTSRGTMTFQLFPAEAPLHVQSFLALAARDHYDGLTFHRVVPDFVIQGGDYRGDGNGGGTWRGRDDALRHEIGPRKFVRGSLGMPRNEDPDSGGSQFFVTHRPTPHLDGRYTIFGELESGFDVLDAIEVGDTILDVRLVDGAPQH